MIGPIMMFHEFYSPKALVYIQPYVKQLLTKQEKGFAARFLFR
jgi:hypothetical protein